ncbi:MAG: LptF/LptG family permease [Verrucomicrobiota bacterium]|nr:LptF/LptG family permease [Verrucomicrobiota bacterium]
MKLIDRYVSRQVLLTSILAVLILSMVLVLGRVFKELLDLLVNKQAPLEFILSFMGYILPFSLTFTIPWGFLTAVLLVFGKMSAENELTALRSNGVSMPRVCASVFVLALFCVGLCLWINVEVAPRAQVKMKDALYNIATSNPLAMFSSDKIIEDFPGQKIYVERSEGPELHNIMVYELDAQHWPVRVVFARRGRLETDSEPNERSGSSSFAPSLLLHLFDARLEERDPDAPDDLTKMRRGITAEESTYAISLHDLLEKSRKKKGLSAMTVRELQTRLKEQQTAATGSDAVLRKQVQARSAARTEVSKRFSFSLASLAFALIGVPLAITAHRKETSMGFLLSLAVAFVYFFFIIIADSVREDPAMRPEWLIWLPNVVFIALGGWLFVRLSRR